MRELIVFPLLEALTLILDSLRAIVDWYWCPRQFSSFECWPRGIGPKLVADEAHALHVLSENIIDINVVLLGYLLQFVVLSARVWSWTSLAASTSAATTSSVIAGLLMTRWLACISSLYRAHRVPCKVRRPQIVNSLCFFVFDTIIIFHHFAHLRPLIQSTPCAKHPFIMARWVFGAESSRPVEGIIARRIRLDLIVFLGLPLK